MKKIAGYLVLFLCAAGNSYSEGFFGGSPYRGWLWFEEKPRAEERGETAREEITPEAAKAEIEAFGKDLDSLRYVMMARPTPETVRAYREKEKEMWTRAELLHDAWDLANFLYPEQRDLIANPVNVHGVKAKRSLEEKENIAKIKEFAEKFDLVLFFSEDCEYCRLLSPVLKNFGETYGFSIEAVGAAGESHPYFKGRAAPWLAKRLGITAFPTVIAVGRDSDRAFELIRGYVSISELEEYSLLAAKYLEKEEKGKNER